MGKGLRATIIVGTLGPLVIATGLLAYLQYQAQRRALLDMAAERATELGQALEASMRPYATAENWSGVQTIMDDLAPGGQIVSAFWLNAASQVTAGTPPRLVGTQFNFSDPGCVVCHGPEAPTPHKASSIISLPGTGRVLRSCTPSTTGGVLLLDLTITHIAERTRAGLQQALLGLGAALVLGTILLGVAMGRAVIGPVERLTEIVRHFGAGDFGQRVNMARTDEIGELAHAFDQMALGLEERARLEQQVVERTATLETLNQELRAKEAARGELLKRLISAREEERRRLARELHDDLAQSLSGLLMSLDQTAAVLPSDADAAHRQIQRTRRITKNALDRTRLLITDLRPIILDDLGLVPAIRWLAENQLRDSGTLVSFQSHGDERRLPADTETAVFRIVQESLHNAAKHADATTVRIDLTWAQTGLVVRVADNGRGFDVDAARGGRPGTTHMGLVGMRERAALVGGDLTVESEPGHGTQITARLPLPPASGHVDATRSNR
jgi:signal transduction histidine kinase